MLAVFERADKNFVGISLWETTTDKYIVIVYILSKIFNVKNFKHLIVIKYC